MPVPVGQAEALCAAVSGGDVLEGLALGWRLFRLPATRERLAEEALPVAQAMARVAWRERCEAAGCSRSVVEPDAVAGDAVMWALTHWSSARRPRGTFRDQLDRAVTDILGRRLRQARSWRDSHLG